MYVSVICGLAEEYSKSILSTFHNYIVSNLGGCIIERLDRRLTKYIYNILHGDTNVIISTKRIPCGWCATVKRDCANCIHLILPLRRPGPPVFLEASHVTQHHGWRSASSLRETLSPIQDQNHHEKPFYTHSLNPPHSINTLIHQSNPPHPHSPQATHRLTHPHLSNPICPLCKTHPHTTEHLFNCTHVYTSNNILDLWLSPGWCLC